MLQFFPPPGPGGDTLRGVLPRARKGKPESARLRKGQFRA